MTSSSKILVIWDDKDIRDVFKFALNEAGHQDVVLASSFDDGLNLITSSDISLAIFPLHKIDYENGKDFCTKLRSLAVSKEIPIIIGDVDHVRGKWEEAFQPLFENGANACFGRVFNITDVIEQVNILLADPSRNNLPDRQSLAA